MNYTEGFEAKIREAAGSGLTIDQATEQLTAALADWPGRRPTAEECRELILGFRRHGRIPGPWITYRPDELLRR